MLTPVEETPTETETTLAVVSDAVDRVADDIAALTEIDGLALRPRPDESILDRYFDTSDGRIGRRRMAVRLRDVHSKRVLTIKGPSRLGSSGGVTRAEQEAAWPDAAWALLRAELGEELAIPDLPPATTDPVSAMRSIGLVISQVRETRRRVRDVVPAGSELPVAELAVDSVSFRLGGRSVHHVEVELEAKAAGGEATIARAAETLASRFSPHLHPWPHGKLTTGKAIASLIDEQGPDSVLTLNGSIRPSAYDAITELLARSPGDAR